MGRKRYADSRKYNFSTLQYYYLEIHDELKQKSTRENQIKSERAKMTPSVRYSVLKRDNYRCRICGSCAGDGVKLHVDHIIPVSKGGLTKEDNLQTLCDRCNLGKGIKPMSSTDNEDFFGRA